MALFLINLIQVQYYLKNQNTSFNETSNSNKTIDHAFMEDEDDDFYEEEDEFQTFDDLLYDLFEKYEESIYENTI